MTDLFRSERSKLSRVLTIVVLSLASLGSAAGPKDGGGGADVTYDFRQTAERAIEKASRLTPLQQLPFNRLKAALQKSRIFVTQDQLSEKGPSPQQDLVAMNFPAQSRILVNEKKWKSIYSLARQESVAFHEVLSLLRIESSGNYRYSQIYYDIWGINDLTGTPDFSAAQVLYDSPNPKVTMTLYTDYLSPFDGYHAPRIKELREKYGEQLKVVVRNFPITSVHPKSADLALAGICAGDQGHFAEAFEILMKQNPYFSKRFDEGAVSDTLTLFSQILGLDRGQWLSCQKSTETHKRLDADLHTVAALKLSGAPAIELRSKTITLRYDYALDMDEYQKAFALILDSSRP